MEPTEQHAEVITTNMQEHHQSIFVIESTTGESLEYRNLIEGPTKSIWEIFFANETGQLAQVLGTRMP